MTAYIGTNGYRLGTHGTNVAVGTSVFEVAITAVADQVQFTAPTLESARAAWNQHMAG